MLFKRECSGSGEIYFQENAGTVYDPNKGKMYMDDGVGVKSPEDFVE